MFSRKNKLPKNYDKHFILTVRFFKLKMKFEKLTVYEKNKK